MECDVRHDAYDNAKDDDKSSKSRDVFFVWFVDVWEDESVLCCALDPVRYNKKCYNETECDTEVSEECGHGCDFRSVFLNVWRTGHFRRQHLLGLFGSLCDMDRSVKDRNILDRFCVEFCAIVEKHAKYIVVSGFVAIASGRTRGTEDIDMVVEKLSKSAFFRLHTALVKKGFVCMQSDDPVEIYDDYLIKNVSVRYTYRDVFVPEMEVKFAKDELDAYQLQTRQKIPLTSLDVWFSSINMNIAFKEEYLKSDKDLEDARHFRIVFADEVNEEEITHIKKMIRRLRL